jgi:hypothetical protein
VDKGGACYVRALPAEQIKTIETASNDYRQVLMSSKILSTGSIVSMAYTLFKN